MATSIHKTESHYQTVFEKGISVLPYATAIIFIIQLIVHKIKIYFIEQLNRSIRVISLLLNCILEDEDELDNNSLNSSEYAYMQSNSVDEYSVIEQDFDDSMSDIEVLRGDDDGETSNRKSKILAKDIEAKILILKKKRQELCSRLLAYKMMEFRLDVSSDSFDTSPIVPKARNFQPKSGSPLPVAEEIDFKVPSSPQSPQVSPLIPRYEESYGFKPEDMARAIQASLEDVAGKAEGGSPSFCSTPPRGDSQEQSHSPGKMKETQNTPTRALPESSQVQFNVVNFVNMWKENNVQVVETPDTRQEDEENTVMEDFMEGERYVGDKGKRPQSGRYAYKKRAKPSESEEPGPSGSDNVPMKKS